MFTLNFPLIMLFILMYMCYYKQFFSLKDAWCSVRFDNVEYQDDIGLVKEGIVL